MDLASYQFMQEERPKKRTSGLSLPMLVSMLQLRRTGPRPYLPR